jgi:hypothetical protein
MASGKKRAMKFAMKFRRVMKFAMKFGRRVTIRSSVRWTPDERDETCVSSGAD